MSESTAWGKREVRKMRSCWRKAAEGVAVRRGARGVSRAKNLGFDKAANKIRDQRMSFDEKDPAKARLTRSPRAVSDSDQTRSELQSYYEPIPVLSFLSSLILELIPDHL